MKLVTLKPYRELDDIQRFELLLAIGMAVAFVCYFIAIYVGNIETEVIRDRFWKNVEPLWDGEIPIIEYPPVALLFFAVPRIFADTPWGYNAAWVVWVYAFTMIGMVFVRRIAEQYGADQKKAMAVYCVLMLLFLQFVADRYDIFPAVMTIIAFYFMITKRPVLAFVILALATLTKVYPLLLAPLFLVPYLTDRDWKGLFTGAAAYAATGLAVVGACLLIEPDLIYGFLDYHMDRPLEIGCVAATLIYPFDMLGITSTWILPATEPGSFGSDDLMGAWPDAVAPFLTPIMIGVIVLAALYYIYARLQRKRSDERTFMILAAVNVVLLMFMIFGKVFSSQYLIWSVPFLAMLVVLCPNRVFNKRLLYLTIASFALTQVNFAYIYGYLGGGLGINDLAMILMLIRNLMIVAMMVMIILEAVRVRREGYSGDDYETEPEFVF